MRENTTHYTVEYTLQDSACGKLSRFWGVRELIFQGISPWYLYVKDCLSLYVCKCHKEHEKTQRSE